MHGIVFVFLFDVLFVCSLNFAVFFCWLQNVNGASTPMAGKQTEVEEMSYTTHRSLGRT